MTRSNPQSITSALGTVTARFCTKNPRESRLLEALSKCKGLMREQLDRAIGASNSPDVVFRLRSSGWDLPCKRLKVIDRDGIARRAGFYLFSDADRARYENFEMKDGGRHES